MEAHIRLTSSEIKEIQNCFRYIFPQTDHLWIFGSRVNPAARGGDIDLYIETQLTDIEEFVDKRGKFVVSLWDKLGEQKIDVIINPISLGWPEQKIHEIARKTGVKLV